jgi:hypothetical protein
LLLRLSGSAGTRERGLDVVLEIEAVYDGRVKVFVRLGGNLVLAGPGTV